MLLEDIIYSIQQDVSTCGISQRWPDSILLQLSNIP